MSRQQFGKNWSWYTEVDKPNEIQDRHVNIAYKIDTLIEPSSKRESCKQGDCKINCSQNLLCLNALGEKKLVTSLTNNKQTKSINRSDYFRKSSNDYAGLVNLGATCYINTYLQVWFNNPIFRDTILNAEFPNNHLILNDNQQKLNESTISSEDLPQLNINKFDNIASNLKLIFYLLKNSIRKSIDTKFFVKALQLDENMQQDAQEFSQLFLNKLTTCLPNKNAVSELFEGEYSYVTQCDNCKYESSRNSSFVELSLNIQNMTTLSDCISQLLKAETLDGDNKYYCSNCFSKQNAHRTMKLKRLPPILNLQLLRFVYDRNSGCKKKLQTRIKFNETLDLSKYLPSEVTNDSSNVYQLGAILMHVGKTAYSGHYMAQIKNFQTQEWFNFNDELITKIENKSKLGCAENDENVTQTVNGTKSTAKRGLKQDDGKNQANQLSTPNAYLLVYYRKDLFSDKPETKKSTKQESASNNDEQFKLVQNDNILLEEWFEKLSQKHLCQRENKLNENQLIKNIYDSLWYNQNDETNKHYFMLTDFIKKWLSFQTLDISNQPQLMDLLNTIKLKYTCHHNRLNPFALNKFKIVNKNGCDLLANYIEFKDLNLFETNNSLTTKCADCVRNIFIYLKLKDKIKDDAKVHKQLLKNLENLDSLDHNGMDSIECPQQLYWIGKESLKSWSSIALKKTQQKLPQTKFNDTTESSNTNNNDIIILNDNSSTTETVTSDEIIQQNDTNVNCFNDEIICEHGNLSTTPNKRLITQELVEFFNGYFDNVKYFTKDSQECPICTNKNETSKQINNEMKSQKELLIDLFNNRNRPQLSGLPLGECVFLINLDFIKEWKTCIKSSKGKQLKIQNNSLLCEHSKLPFNDATLDDTPIVLLTEGEWMFLSGNYDYDLQLKLEKIDTDMYLFEPEICDQCFHLKEVEKLAFKRKKIFIRLVETNDDDIDKNGTIENGAKNKIDCHDSSSSSVDYPPKKLKKSEDFNEINCDDYDNEFKATARKIETKGTRRSRRTKKAKDDFSLIVSSDESVRQIKIKIASKFGMLVSEQHLYFNNRELNNEENILSYKISPNDLLILKVDKTLNNDDNEFIIHESVRGPEIGFRGTNLLSF